jgi:hypothetical protein
MYMAPVDFGAAGAVFLLLLAAALLSSTDQIVQAGRVLSSTLRSNIISRSLTSNTEHATARSLVGKEAMVMSYAAPNITRPVPSCYANAPHSQLWAQGNYTYQNRPVQDDSLFDLMIDICNFIGKYYSYEGGCCSAVDLYGDSNWAQNNPSVGRSLSDYPVLTPLPGYQFKQLGYSNWKIIDSQNFVCSNINPNATSALACQHSWSQAEGAMVTLDNSITVGKSSTTSWSVSTCECGRC